jgi:MYXO-CTERM domain-containing protein
MVLVAFALLLPACDVEEAVDRSRTPVIGGGPTQEGEYPATGALVLQGQFMCTGTLIRPDVVLTAAHCVDSLLTGGNVPGFTLRLDATSPEAADVYEGASASAHPDFSLFAEPTPGVGRFYDIGLLHLVEEVAGVEPARLPSAPEAQAQLKLGADVYIVGYGYRDVEATMAGQKYDAVASLREVGDYELYISENGQPQNCQGDSGGPAFLEVPGDGLRIFGIVSRAPDMNTTCDHGGIDTRVDPYLDWISMELGEAVPPDAGTAPGVDAGVAGGDAGIGGDDVEEGGCGCQSSSGDPAQGLVFLLVAAIVLRRARRVAR